MLGIESLDVAHISRVIFYLSNGKYETELKTPGFKLDNFFQKIKLRRLKSWKWWRYAIWWYNDQDIKTDADQDIPFDDDKHPEECHCLLSDTETSDYLASDLTNHISTFSQKSKRKMSTSSSSETAFCSMFH